MTRSQARNIAEYVFLFVVIVVLSMKHAPLWIWVICGFIYVAAMIALRAAVRDKRIDPGQQPRPNLG